MSLNTIKGKVWIFGDHINTDQIISTKYMLLNSKKEMAQYAFESIDKDFSKNFKQGDIIVGGINFGCGSAREQAPEVLKELKAGAVIASSFNMTFYRNAINLGIPAIISVDFCRNVNKGDLALVDIVNGNISNLSTCQDFHTEPFPEIIKEILDCSGLVNYYFRKREGIIQ